MAGLSVEPLGDGWYKVSDGSRRWHVAVVGGGSEYWVFVEGLVTQVKTTTGNTRPRSKGGAEAGVMAPMPATVLAIHATPGQSVKLGDTLIVLEAMKMELPVRSPRNGVIKSILCTKGELVQPGVNLLEFE
ncbi:MAG: biotin/lipoyl-containing protein [Vicinamibacterales bacterium]